MKLLQAFKYKNKDWEYLTPKVSLTNPLVLVFASRPILDDSDIFHEVKLEFPYSHIVFGSTAGEILGTNVFDDTITVTAIEFNKSTFHIQRANSIELEKDAELVGKKLFESMPNKDSLKHLFVVSEGSFINGSSLIKGIKGKTNLPFSLSGGLCGDGPFFNKTLASYNENPKEGEVVLIGFYGETLEITTASYGGWIPFGPERIITKSEGNILKEIDGQPALDWYKKYLGDKANQLPQASLLYPLNVQEVDKSEPVVRTLLNIDTEHQSMILAGDAPVGSSVQLMMASIDGIIDGAQKAAEHALKHRKTKPKLALVVSCIGRKLIMNQRVEEEIEEVSSILGSETKIVGFYSYGEIAPYPNQTGCELHNQTMTLTLISE